MWRAREDDRKNFYPRPPRGGRPGHPDQSIQTWKISIHALREEGDYHQCEESRYLDKISIHALREEGDTRPAEIMPWA